MPAALLTFLSDYGVADEFVGVCHAVIAGIAPQARVIDLTHGVPRQDVRAGALLLRSALAYCPAGVHLAVVDPDVGAGRRAVALRTADDPGRLLVGPDNGLLIPAAESCGGIIEAIDIGRSPVRLQPVSATFHGRDLFAPVAAHLAMGRPLSELGEFCDPDALVTLQLPRPVVLDHDRLGAEVIIVDRYGNVQLGAGHADLARVGLRLGRAVTVATSSGEHPAHLTRTYAEATHGELILYEDGSRTLALAVSQGDAATRLQLRPGDWVTLAPGSPH